MHGNDKRKILRLIIDDPASTDVERAEAELELNALTGDQSGPPSRRLGRNANVPQTQADQDADIENWLRRDLLDSNLTTSGLHEIFHGFDSSTQGILDAFANNLFGLFPDNLAEIQLLIDLHRRTQSDFVREKATQTIHCIADFSPIESAKTEAQQFLNQLGSTADTKGNNEQPTAEPEDRTN